MSAENLDSNSQQSKPRANRSQLKTWLWIVIVVALIVAGYEIVSHWENFTRGLSGKPETTDS